eukprot:jgi/Ulvmu1/219/UM001_0223.1
MQVLQEPDLKNAAGHPHGGGEPGSGPFVPPLDFGIIHIHDGEATLMSGLGASSSSLHPVGSAEERGSLRSGTLVAVEDQEVDVGAYKVLESNSIASVHAVAPAVGIRTGWDAVEASEISDTQEKVLSESVRTSQDQCIRFAPFDNVVHVTSAVSSAVSTVSSTADETVSVHNHKALGVSDGQHETNARLRSLWRMPVQIRRALSVIQGPATGGPTLFDAIVQKKSSMRSPLASRWRMLPRKHVRFKGMMTPLMVTIVSIMGGVFSSGSRASAWWDRVMAVVNAADFLMLPLSTLGREFTLNKEAWLKQYDKQVTEFVSNKHILWSRTEIWLDGVFVLDLVIRLARAFVLDLGFAESTADRLVDSAPRPESSPTDRSRAGPVVKENAMGLTFRMGPALRKQLFVSIPVRLLLMLPMWIIHNMHHVSNLMVTCAALARCYRLLDLMAFFSARQEDIATDVRWVAFCKFSFIIYATGHWLGCTYFALAAYNRFESSMYRLNWVDAWVQQTFVKYSWLSSSAVYDYVVMLFKGFSVVTTLGYEVAVPEREDELILSLVTQNIKIIIEAYILGTLFHYLVKKDPELEAARDLMAGLQLYCKERGLPAELTSKMQAYLIFQQKKSSAISASVLRGLPQSLQARVAQAECRSTINRNMHLFSACNEQFLQRLMMSLVEVSLMPEEVVINPGDMARELFFAVTGTLVVKDSKGSLVELLSGEGTAPCVTGTVSFLLGVPEPYSVKARANEDSAVLVITKADFDDVISHYPEQSDIILTNTLMQHGLTRDGDDIGVKGFDQHADEEGYVQLRGAIKRELKRSQEAALADLTYAASVGHVDTVSHLLARGLPIDAGDYDGRTTLHLAVAEGRLEIVRILLDKGAQVDVTDRWGNTPLMEALKLQRMQIAELLVDKGASLSPSASSLVKDAAEHDVAVLHLACVKAGADPNSCDHDRRSVLHTLCAESNLKAVEALLSLGVQVNCTDRWGGTPIQDAIKAGSELIVSLLKKHGARISCSFESDAFFNAARNGNIAHVDLLSQAGADLTMANYDKVSGLHIAAGTGQLLTLYRLTTCRAVDVNIEDVWGMTPLDHAVRAEQWACSVLLSSCAGECNDSGHMQKLQQASEQKLLPRLAAVRQTLRHALSSTSPEIQIMGTAVAHGHDQALRFRRQMLEEGLKTLPKMRQHAEEMQILLHDFHVLLKAVRALMEIVLPPHKSGRPLYPQTSLQSGSADSHHISLLKCQAIVKATMRALMRCSTARDVLWHLAEQLKYSLNIFEPTTEDVCHVFEALGVPFDKARIEADGTDLLLHGTIGVRQLSITRLITWPYFCDQIRKQANVHVLRNAMASQTGSNKTSTKSTRASSKWWRSRRSSRWTDNVARVNSRRIVPLSPSSGSFHGLGDGDPIQTVVLRLNTLYVWITEAFSAMDLDEAGCISLAAYGSVIQKALTGAGLEQMWSILASESPEHSINEDAFRHVYMQWMGFSDSWAVTEGIQTSRAVELTGEESGLTDSFSDTDGTTEDDQQPQDIAEFEALMDLKEVADLNDMIAQHGGRSFQVMLDLSPLERFLWGLGVKLAQQEMAWRAFTYIDDNENGTISIAAMEILLKLAQDELPLAKTSFDCVENLKTECAQDPGRGVCLDDVVTFFQTIPMTTVQHKLPHDAHWGVCHPRSRLLLAWDVMIRIVALYFFWDVPFNIAFQASPRLGLLYEIANQLLEGLLIVDMVVNVFRAFYNEQGVLIYNLKSIRVHYISGSFFVDLVAAMPFQVLVQINGNVNFGYASWLRLPKMLRIYRMLQLYRQMGRSVAHTSISMRILQLLPLILGLTHVYGCIWWYIGTAGRALAYTDNIDLTGSWIYYYSGLGDQHVWSSDVPILKQYILSCYWAASTLSTAALVGDATPKNIAEMLFTIWSMLTTLTLYAFVVGEISNAVMANDQALVSMRAALSRVQTFLTRHRLPRALAVDIVSAFQDSMKNSAYSAQQINSLISSNLRVEVAMHMSLPLIKAHHLFHNCSSGFMAGLSVQMRETVMASDEFLFRANAVCDELFLISSSTVDILKSGPDGSEMVSETRSRGGTVGELSFFFRLRHLYTACVGKNRATVFVLPYSDYKQLAATYVDDDAAVLAALVDSAGTGKARSGSISQALVDSAAQENHAMVMAKVDEAIQRRTEQHIVKLLDATSKNDVQLVQKILDSGKVSVSPSEPPSCVLKIRGVRSGPTYTTIQRADAELHFGLHARHGLACSYQISYETSRSLNLRQRFSSGGQQHGKKPL